MKRGIVILTNLELTALSNLAIEQNCTQQDLLQKIKPVANQVASFEQTVQLSAEDVETLLDYMPLPGTSASNSLESAKTQLQQFLSDSRSTNL